MQISNMIEIFRDDVDALRLDTKWIGRLSNYNNIAYFMLCVISHHGLYAPGEKPISELC